jgi:hypothetical protein
MASSAMKMARSPLGYTLLQTEGHTSQRYERAS